MKEICKKDLRDMEPDELWEELNWLRENGKLMYDYWGTLNSEFKQFCYNDSKRVGNDLKETIKRSLIDPFNKVIMSKVVAETGRTPYVIYCIMLRLMWDALYAGERGLLRRVAKSAVRYGIAKWA